MSPRRLALAGVLAPGLFLAGVVIAGLTWPNYHHASQNISDLGGTEAPFPLVQNATFVTFGLLVVAVAFALRRGGVGAPAAGAVAPLIGVFGAMMIVQGLTPCTPGCAEGTPVDLAHVLTALAGSLAVITAMLATWRWARRDGRWQVYGTYSGWSAVVTLVSLAAWLAAAALDPGRFHAGVLQRLFFAAVLAWLAATGLRLHQVLTRGWSPPPSAPDRAAAPGHRRGRRVSTTRHGTLSMDVLPYISGYFALGVATRRLSEWRATAKEGDHVASLVELVAPTGQRWTGELRPGWRGRRRAVCGLPLVARDRHQTVHAVVST